MKFSLKHLICTTYFYTSQGNLHGLQAEEGNLGVLGIGVILISTAGTITGP